MAVKESREDEETGCQLRETIGQPPAHNYHSFSAGLHPQLATILPLHCSSAAWHISVPTQLTRQRRDLVHCVVE